MLPCGEYKRSSIGDQIKERVMPNFCRYCGGKLEPDDTFCSSCGKPVVFTKPVRQSLCPQCGGELKGTEKFCKYCGVSLRARSDQDEKQERSFYIFDFLKNLLRVQNIPSLIYLFLNIVVITLIVYSGMPQNLLAAIGISVVIYLISVTIALSPIGEFLIRYQTGCKEIKDPQVLQRLQPVFQEVYRRSKRQNPTIPDDLKFYMNEDKAPNAFATGRKTVCVTRGLLQMPDHYIAAILGHEFGHLSHHDTDLLLLITVGNMFVNIIILIGRVFINFMLLIAALFVNSDFGVVMHRLISFLCAVSVNLMHSLWSWIGVLLVMKTSRGNEFEADHFSGELGYGRDLADALEALEGGSGGRPQGVFAALSASHPPTQARIAKLRADF